MSCAPIGRARLPICLSPLTRAQTLASRLTSLRASPSSQHVVAPQPSMWVTRYRNSLTRQSPEIVHALNNKPGEVTYYG